MQWAQGPTRSTGVLGECTGRIPSPASSRGSQRHSPREVAFRLRPSGLTGVKGWEIHRKSGLESGNTMCKGVRQYHSFQLRTGLAITFLWRFSAHLHLWLSFVDRNSEPLSLSFKEKYLKNCPRRLSSFLKTQRGYLDIQNKSSESKRQML